MLVAALALVALAFFAYAMITQYRLTPVEQSVPARVWAAVVAAAGAVGAAIMAWFHSGTPTQ